MFYYMTIVYHNQCKKQSEIFIGRLKDHVVSVRSTGKFAKERNFCFPGRNVPFMFLILFVLEKGNHPISIIYFLGFLRQFSVIWLALFLARGFWNFICWMHEKMAPRPTRYEITNSSLCSLHFSSDVLNLTATNNCHC